MCKAGNEKGQGLYYGPCPFSGRKIKEKKEEMFLIVLYLLF